MVPGMSRCFLLHLCQAGIAKKSLRIPYFYWVSCGFAKDQL
jgi:hypothetical protein